MITLEQTKKFLNIDFPDNDEFLESLISAVKEKASRVSGIPQSIIDVDEFGDITIIPNPEFDNPELDNAMLMDIAQMYQSRGEDMHGSKSSLAIYRGYSKRPMF